MFFACATPMARSTLNASVVAVQYHPGKTLVAARFQGEVPNWIVKS